RRETAPPREPTRPPAKTLAEPPPFKAPDTWQRHLSRATGVTGIRHERSRVLPPPPPPREPTPLPQPPRQRTTAHLREAPAAERPARRKIYPRVKRSAGRQVRRMPTGFGPRGSLASYVAGFVLVGLIGGISIWGFWEMHRRLDRV